MNKTERTELVEYRLKKARETFQEVQILINHNLWNTAVNRSYYACYYAVIALLVEFEINAQTHSGVRQMFGLHFIKSDLIGKEEGKFYSYIFDMRQTGDYDDYIDYKQEDVMDLIQPTHNLISSIEALILLRRKQKLYI